MFSILKGWSWFGKGAEAETIQWSSAWVDIKFNFDSYSEQLFGLT
jgi:hypothetical protein